jgi:3-polyprenyl-4-hydroxybenzoate decarboxylase
MNNLNQPNKEKKPSAFSLVPPALSTKHTNQTIEDLSNKLIMEKLKALAINNETKFEKQF